VSGDTLLTAALVELGADPDQPVTIATREGDGWRIDGVKSNVPGVHMARTILVPASAGGDVVVLLVPADAPGLTAVRQQTMNHEPLFEVTFDGVLVDAGAQLGANGQGREVLSFIVNRTTVASCAVVSGVAERAVKMTAQYTIDRKQFERQIGTFQAVGQRMADSFIDMQAIELTMLQAATHLDEGSDDPLEVATAKFWAADGGNRIGHAALHIHGGISIDLDYAIHRYFLWLKQAEFTLGSATPQLLKIGKILADEPV
jgi:acyl-CoA dehydrogenase